MHFWPCIDIGYSDTAKSSKLAGPSHGRFLLYKMNFKLGWGDTTAEARSDGAHPGDPLLMKPLPKKDEFRTYSDIAKRVCQVLICWVIYDIKQNTRRYI